MLELSLLPYPSFPGSSSLSLTLLSRVACSGYYQNAQARVQARLTDGSSVAVTSVSSVAVTGGGDLVSILSRNGVRALVRPYLSGAVELQATFHAQE